MSNTLVVITINKELRSEQRDNLRTHLESFQQRGYDILVLEQGMTADVYATKLEPNTANICHNPTKPDTN